MKSLCAAFAGLLSLSAYAADVPGAVHCHSCDEWNQPQKPFNVVGNTWYVGTSGLSAILVTGPAGHVLLDGALPQSAPLIQKNIEALGFHMKDVKYILNSHAHYDHSGGIPALQRASGAVVVASVAGAHELAAGTTTPDDPQYEPKDAVVTEKITKVQTIADGGTINVGPLKITAHLTPGHTTGSTTWSWESCDQGVCRQVVYADSLNPVSADGFHFTGDATHPDISGSMRASIEKVANLKCDVIVSVHPGFTDTFDKLKTRTPAKNTFIDPQGCKTYAAGMMKALERRLENERKEKAGLKAASK